MGGGGHKIGELDGNAPSPHRAGFAGVPVFGLTRYRPASKNGYAFKASIKWREI